MPDIYTVSTISTLLLLKVTMIHILNVLDLSDNSCNPCLSTCRLWITHHKSIIKSDLLDQRTFEYEKDVTAHLVYYH